MFISYFVLAIGLVIAFYFYTFVGRLGGLSATALWSMGTAYFVMPPSYSLRVSNPHDLAALALYGVVGFVIASVKPVARSAPTRSRQKIPRIPPCQPGLVNIKDVVADLMASSELGRRLRHRNIEIDVCGLQTFPCSCSEAVSVLSGVLAAVLIDPQLRRVSVQVARRPEVASLFVSAHTTWPLPFQDHRDW